MDGRSDIRRIETAELVYGGVNQLLRGTGLTFVVRPLLLDALDDDDLGAVASARLHQTSGRLGEDEVVSRLSQL